MGSPRCIICVLHLFYTIWLIPMAHWFKAVTKALTGTVTGAVTGPVTMPRTVCLDEVQSIEKSEGFLRPGSLRNDMALVSGSVVMSLERSVLVSYLACGSRATRP
jgi:hypothetical protein